MWFAVLFYYITPSCRCLPHPIYYFMKAICVAWLAALVATQIVPSAIKGTCSLRGTCQCFRVIERLQWVCREESCTEIARSVATSLFAAFLSIFESFLDWTWSIYRSIRSGSWAPSASLVIVCPAWLAHGTRLCYWRAVPALCWIDSVSFVVQLGWRVVWCLRLGFLGCWWRVPFGCLFSLLCSLASLRLDRHHCSSYHPPSTCEFTRLRDRLGYLATVAACAPQVLLLL